MLCDLEDAPRKPETRAKEAPAAEAEEMPILFVSATCPNCRIAMNYMDKAGFRYQKVLAAENPEVKTQRIMLNDAEPFVIQGVAVKVLHNLN